MAVQRAIVRERKEASFGQVVISTVKETEHGLANVALIVSSAPAHQVTIVGEELEIEELGPRHIYLVLEPELRPREDGYVHSGRVLCRIEQGWRVFRKRSKDVMAKDPRRGIFRQDLRAILADDGDLDTSIDRHLEDLFALHHPLDVRRYPNVCLRMESCQLLKIPVLSGGPPCDLRLSPSDSIFWFQFRSINTIRIQVQHCSPSP